MKIAVDKLPSAPKAKKSTTRIIFLLDRSTSMNSMREEAVSGFNQYLVSQKKVKGKATMSLIFFDNTYHVVYEGIDVKEAPEIVCGRMGETIKSPYAYTPQGMTSLFDYVHSTIMRYKDTAKENEKTIFAILTDGDDTSSHTHNHTTVSQAIKEAQDGLGWEILFVGANMNAGGFARSVGIKLGNVTQFDYTKKGLGDVLGSVGMASSYLRGDAGTRSKMANAGIGGQSLDLTSTYALVKDGKLAVDDKDTK